MARIPTYPTLTDLIQYFITMYYHELSKQKTHPSNEDKIRVFEKVEKNYLNQLAKNTEWNTTEAQQALKGEIDYLTGIYSKIEAEKAKKENRANIHKLFQ